MQRLQWLSLCAGLGFAFSAVDPAGAQAGTDLVLNANVRDGHIESSSEPYPGTSVQWGRAVVLLDAPAADVLAIVQNYGGYKDFLPNFETSRVLSQRGNSALIYAQVSVMRGAAHIWAELKIKPHDVGATRVIEAKMTKGNVDLLQATWEVTPVDAKHTLVAFQIIVDPKLPLPTGLVNDENTKTARKTLKALRALLAAHKPVAKP